MNQKTGLLLLLTVLIMSVATRQQRQYVCLPCGSSCDAAVHTKPGTCEHCHMQLVDKATVVFKKVQPAQLCKFIAAHKQVLLLDVRTPEEFNGTAEEKFGKLKNAINIPVQQLEQRVKELNKYKNYDIVVYCSHSHRSPRASYLLNQQGFKKVTNMEGGMSVWKEQVTENNCGENLYVAQ
jgi:rhodanese-related sulfurtransferase